MFLFAIGKQGMTKYCELFLTTFFQTFTLNSFCLYFIFSSMPFLIEYDTSLKTQKHVLLREAHGNLFNRDKSVHCLYKTHSPKSFRGSPFSGFLRTDTK